MGALFQGFAVGGPRGRPDGALGLEVRFPVRKDQPAHMAR